MLEAREMPGRVVESAGYPSLKPAKADMYMNPGNQNAGFPVGVRCIGLRHGGRWARRGRGGVRP
jgi:hypothetical protein